MEVGAQDQEAARQQAIERLKKKRDFATHFVVFLAVNAVLVVIWAVTKGDDTIFWPIFPIIGWGIGLAANAWDVYGRKPITEDEVRRETDRLRGGG